MSRKETDAVDVAARQDPLRKVYRGQPRRAWITDSARTRQSEKMDPVHGVVEATSQDLTVPFPFGIHRAVGGDHDLPNPGSILCAALAACLDSTIRMIADRMGVGLGALEVSVSAEVDVRGTLQVDREVPVGFQAMRCRVELDPATDVGESRIRRLVSAAERSCVVLQTLRGGIEVRTGCEIKE